MVGVVLTEGQSRGDAHRDIAQNGEEFINVNILMASPVSEVVDEDVESMPNGTSDPVGHEQENRPRRILV